MPIAILIAVLLWATLAFALVLGVWGVIRRSGGALLVAGALSLGFCWVAVLSVGRFALVIPLLELALGAGYLAKARRSALQVLGGAAVVLYAAQLAALLSAIGRR